MADFKNKFMNYSFMKGSFFMPEREHRLTFQPDLFQSLFVKNGNLVFIHGNDAIFLKFH